MNWMRFFEVVIGAGVVSTFTDWVIAGDWIQKRITDPQIWRTGSLMRTALASLLPFLTSAAFAYTANRMAISSVHSAIKLAGAIWLICPLPLILANSAFLKLSKGFVATYAVSWLVKLMIVAVLVGRLLR